MKFISVESSMILGVRYDKQTKHLDIIFRTGDKYRYKEVPPLEFEGLMSAESKGHYMHKRILGGRYDYERLD